MILLTEAKPAQLEPLIRLSGVTNWDIWPPQAEIPNTNALVVVVGKKAWNALKTRQKFHQWRGFLWQPNVYVTDVYQPTQPRMDEVIRRDWKKIPLILSGRWPRPVPERMTFSLESRDSYELHRTLQGMRDRGGPIVMDVETGVVCISRTGRRGIQIFRPHTYDHQHALHDILGSLGRNEPLLFHNAAHDLKELRLDPSRCARIDDTMVLHSILKPGLPHSLRFLQSVYGQYPLLKGSKEPGLHCWGDVLATIDAWEMMRLDHLSEKSVDMATDEQWLRYEACLRAIPEAMRTGINLARVADPTYYRKPFKEREEEMV